MSHTPGPWVVDEFMKTVVAASDDIGILNTKARGEDVVLSNVKLIAAAPDLLAACEALYDVLMPAAVDFNDEELKAIELALAALKKAKGL